MNMAKPELLPALGFGLQFNWSQHQISYARADDEEMQIARPNISVTADIFSEPKYSQGSFWSQNEVLVYFVVVVVVLCLVNILFRRIYEPFDGIKMLNLNTICIVTDSLASGSGFEKS